MKPATTPSPPVPKRTPPRRSARLQHDLWLRAAAASRVMRMAVGQRVPTKQATAQREGEGSQGSTLVRGDASGHSRVWRWVALGVLGALAVAAGATYLAYARDMRETRAHLAVGSQIVATRHGPIEYTAWGEGPAVLVVHGSGGGYDQGMLMARAYGGEGFRWISPSRFGYLRTPLPDGASTTAQADAFADLLDALGIERAAILAMSGGVPPSLQFAQRYPERTSALVLLSSAPLSPAWSMRSSRSRTASTVSRTKEPRSIHARYLVEEITTPTLVIHAKDDQINPFTYGEYTTQHIRGAEFLPLATGGTCCWGTTPRSKRG